MPESPLPPWRAPWPPPPVSGEVLREQVKLSASALNAASVACLVTAFFGHLITSIPDSDLTSIVRLALFLTGAVLHFAARTLLRYM